jgi:hypothetical protein
MRQGQQHRRGRGRGGHGGNQGGGHNNHRKVQNPTSRTYHSNGPDGKVSGTPQSIADKYLSLARDALSSGDPVLAENYMQHAEHYNRIILAYREQTAHDDGHGGPRQAADANDFGDDETDTFGRDLSPLPPEQPRRPAPEFRQRDEQPRLFDQPREPREAGEDRPRFEGREGRFQDRRPHRDRYGERGDRGHDRRDDRGDRGGDRHRHGGDRDRFGVGERYAPVRAAYGEDGQPIVDARPRDDRGRDDRGRDDRPRDERRDDRADRAFRQPNGARHDQQPVLREVPPPPPVDLGPEPGLPDVTPAMVPPDGPRIDAATRAAPRRRERGPALAEESQQPDFLRRPVRRPRREPAPDGEAGDVTPLPRVPDNDPAVE